MLFSKSSVLTTALIAFVAVAGMNQPAKSIPKRCQNQPADSLCAIDTFCESAGGAYCIVHFGERMFEPGLENVTRQCVQREIRKCTTILNPKTAPASTNPTDLPHPFDCNLLDARTGAVTRVSDTLCRMENYCREITALVCADNIGPKKYTPEGKAKLVECNKEYRTSCLDAFNP